MTDYFENLVKGYDQAGDGVVKLIIYDAMLKYASEYHPGYVCYDMDMYVAIYKCATNSGQREYALNHISSIIDDDYIGHEELMNNFREFISMKEFLKDEDKCNFDRLCMKELNYFNASLERTKGLAKCGQADSYLDALISKTESELKKIAELIVSTGMSEMVSYQEALKILKD